MFDREEFLRKHGLVEVAESQGEILSDTAVIRGSNVLEAPSMTEFTHEQRSQKNMVSVAATAFANARRKLRGQPVIAIDSGGQELSNQTSFFPDSRSQSPGNVEIINAVPESMVDGVIDSSRAGGPGPKGIVIDKDRGIIGMQG